MRLQEIVRPDRFSRTLDQSNTFQFAIVLTGLVLNETCQVLVYIKNRPSQLRWAMSSTFSIRQLARLRPTIQQIVIVIIIVVIGEVKRIFHNGGIIAQT